MPFAYLQAGQPVEIMPGEPFSTPQLKIMSEADQGFALSPIGTVIDHHVEHPAEALAAFTEEDLERYQIQHFAEAADPPMAKIVGARTLVVTNGVVSARATYVPTPPPAVPTSITRTQAWLELQAIASPVNPGKTRLDDVNAELAANPDGSLLVYWQTSTDFHRNHPKLVATVAAMNWPAEMVDGLFVSAAQRS